MTRRLNITAVRKQLLSLPESLGPGEEVEVVRHRKVVLKIVHPYAGESENPFIKLSQSLQSLETKKKRRLKIPRNLASQYKQYLYGKKS